jgi:hypothetical protein
MNAVVPGTSEPPAKNLQAATIRMSKSSVKNAQAVDLES